MIDHYPGKFKRLSKTTARKLWRKIPITVVASKMDIESPWHPGITHIPSEEDNNYSFDQWVANFEYYNTSYEEGYYSTFYCAIHEENK